MERKKRVVPGEVCAICLERGNHCTQRDSAEHEGYAKASRSFNRIWKERDSAQPKLLEAILYKDNLNRAYKRVKANKGAAGIDGMSIEEALPYLKEHQQELINRILRGKYTSSPVRRVEIPKPDGGMRKLGIPTVIDRTIQQAITQQLVPIYEPLFADGSFGYRPGRSAEDAILKVKEYAEQGYTYAVSLDLSKYFDTLNHEILLNLLRKNVKDERVVQLIKRYLKSGVMENGVVMETEEGDPTSLVTTISGMRRFYEMFPEIRQFRLEIPSRMPRKRSIIDVYSEEEQEKIASFLSSSGISRRDTAICLLSFETGLHSVDICNLRLGDVDWKHNVIHIVQSKTQRPLNQPIRSSYGNAMVGYLLEERPRCKEDYFFSLSMRLMLS